MTYCDLFKLDELPFRLTPDPQFLFASKQHSRAKAYMESTIWLADGFVVITGEIGSGKTTLIESFLEGLPDDVVIAHVSQTQLSPTEFLQAILVEFGFKPYGQQKVELLANLKQFMLEQYAAGKKLLLIIDEAQNLSHEVLEEVRLLSGIEAQKEKLLRIIIAGQPELSEKLDSPQLEQLTQRVRLRFHLVALSESETKHYVEHRLSIAGSHGRQIFTDEALEIVYRYSGGVPRLTNILCDTALLCAFADEKDTIDAEIIEAAVDELQWQTHAEKKRAREAALRRQKGYVPADDAPLASFQILHNDELVGDYELPLGRSVIGRTIDNDIQIRSKFVSRHHAQVITSPRRCIVEDLNSTNGTFVSAKRVKQHELEDGDVVNLGEHKLVYRDRREGVRRPQQTAAADSEMEPVS
jgi:general secretion pathway protein A